MPVLLGYMRVSKADGSQAVDLQLDALLAAGVHREHLYDDRASGRRDDRPGLAACLKAARDGDTLLVWKLDLGPCESTRRDTRRRQTKPTGNQPCPRPHR
jgi:hypothetical protein